MSGSSSKLIKLLGKESLEAQTTQTPSIFTHGILVSLLQQIAALTSTNEEAHIYVLALLQNNDKEGMLNFLSLLFAQGDNKEKALFKGVASQINLKNLFNFERMAPSQVASVYELWLSKRENLRGNNQAAHLHQLLADNNEQLNVFKAMVSYAKQEADRSADHKADRRLAEQIQDASIAKKTELTPEVVAKPVVYEKVWVTFYWFPVSTRYKFGHCAAEFERNPAIGSPLLSVNYHTDHNIPNDLGLNDYTDQAVKFKMLISVTKDQSTAIQTFDEKYLNNGTWWLCTRCADTALGLVGLSTGLTIPSAMYESMWEKKLVHDLALVAKGASIKNNQREAGKFTLNSVVAEMIGLGMQLAQIRSKDKKVAALKNLMEKVGDESKTKDVVRSLVASIQLVGGSTGRNVAKLALAVISWQRTQLLALPAPKTNKEMRDRLQQLINNDIQRLQAELAREKCYSLFSWQNLGEKERKIQELQQISEQVNEMKVMDKARLQEVFLNEKVAEKLDDRTGQNFRQCITLLANFTPREKQNEQASEQDTNAAKQLAEKLARLQLHTGHDNTESTDVHPPTTLSQEVSVSA